MKKYILIFLLSIVSNCVWATEISGTISNARLQYFPLGDVELLESPFKHAQDLDIDYLLALNPDRLLAPFLREAGLKPKAETYTNWESSGLDGHIGGHYLSALSYMYASTKDVRIGERLTYMIAEMKRVQDINGDGYIGGIPGSKVFWKQIAAGEIQAAGYRLNTKWVPLYNIHKTYAGLRDAWLYTGNVTARDMLIKMTDWIYQLTSGLSDEQIQSILRCEHGGLNETFADVAAITGDHKYLILARRFSHMEILNPLLKREDHLTGLHANTQIPKIIGFERISELESDKSWGKAAAFFWETVTENRSVCIGGNSVHEHFNPVEDFQRLASSEQGPETCNTYNMLRLTKMLHAVSPSAKYSDFYERALYNHILSTQNPRTGGFVYFTPMRPEHYRVYSQPETSMWCCVGSGIENHAKYGEMIYANADSQLYINLFIPSRLTWKEEGVEIIQENHFPQEAGTNLTINLVQSKMFELKIRYPEWTKKMEVRVNGKHLAITKELDGYVSLKRKWNKGDKVEVTFSMDIHIQRFPDHSAFRCVMCGPIVLAAKCGKENMVGMFADDSRGGHIAKGPKTPFSEVPIVASDDAKLLSDIIPVDGKPLHFKMNTLSGQVELEPFYGIHESRYTIYWPTTSIKNPAEALAQATVDVVYCGQQQPESDHSIFSENAEAGYSDNHHWRKASGWFSYEMENMDKSGLYLLVTYLNTDTKAQTNIFINDKLIKTFTSGIGGKGEEVQALFQLAGNRNLEKLTVKVGGGNGFTSAPITDIRILNKVVIYE